MRVTAPSRQLLGDLVAYLLRRLRHLLTDLLRRLVRGLVCCLVRHLLRGLRCLQSDLLC